MLNAIRIVVGIITLIIALVGAQAFIVFSLGYRDQTPTGINLIINIIFLLIPFIASWLLLLPRSRKQAFIGLVIAVLFIGYGIVSEIIAVYTIE